MGHLVPGSRSRWTFKISTLRAYLEKLGFGMEIAALSATGERIPLQIGES